MPLTAGERTFLIEAYFRTGRLINDRWLYSYDDCKEQFSVQYPNTHVPSKSTINSLIHRFRTFGAVTDRKRPGTAKKLSAQEIENIRTRIVHSPKKSLRRLSAETGVSLGTCHNVVRKTLKFFPYRVTVMHELLPADYQKRIQYCNWFQQHMTDNMLNCTYFSDEAWFHLSGYVNSQNNRMWSTENPHAYTESPLHPIKIGVWVAISPLRIIGPIFFDNTINSERYCLIINNFVNNLTAEERGQCWLQQDNATSHTSRISMAHIRQTFDNRVISKDLWPPRSPDLTPLDYFLFGYCKQKVYERNPHTLDELKQYITDAINGIQIHTLQDIFINMRRRVALCLTQNGNHFQHLL